MAKSRHTRSFSSGGKNYMWAAARIGRNIPTTTSRDLLVADSDWNVTGGSKSCTIIAMRGYLSFRSLGTTTGDAKWYIGKLDKDATAADPDVVDTYVEEDIMYTGGLNKGAGAVDAVQLHHEFIDVKAKRRIKSGTDIILASSALVTTQVRMDGIIRTLLLLNNG